MPTLRGYQVEAVAAALDGWERTPDPGGLQLATGLGKTVIFSELARISHALGQRTAIFVHRDELVRQTVEKLQQAESNMRIGIVQGPSMGVFADVTVCSVQTLQRRLGKIRPDQFQRIIVDEVHHAAAKSYQDALQHFGCYEGRTRMLGVTATMARSDRQGLGAVLPGGVWFERGIAWGVEHGYLVPAEVRTVAVAELDTDTIRKGVDGDLAAGQLGKAMSQAHAGPQIADAYRRYACDPYGRFRRAISFAPTIEIAEAWAADYRAAGARVAVITGSTSPAERQAAYEGMRRGTVDVLSSVMVLTEGFDLPAVEVAIIGRPTKSMPLLTQMVGRVLRPSPGKRSALLLDVVGALGGGLARSYDLSIPEPKEGEAPPQDVDRLPVGREKLTLAVPKRLGFVARDLLTGEPIKAPKRRKGMVEPEWLRTKGGVPFLPQTPAYPFRLFCWARDDSPSPWWRLAREDGSAPEPIELAEGADIRDLHPGLPEEWLHQPATAAQLQLCTARALGHPATKAEASTLIETWAAGLTLDRLCRPKMPIAPPPGVL